VVGDDGVVPAYARGERRKHAGRTAHLVDVDDIGPAEGAWQRWYDRARRVAADPGQRAEDSNPQPAFATMAGDVAERDELAGHLIGESPRQLERVSFATAEQSSRTERRRSDMDDPHADRPPNPG
jgi:hypothetical protein